MFLVVFCVTFEIVCAERIIMNSNQLLVEDHARGTILGNCVGDAIGLSTEFMTKSEAADCYTQFRGCLEYQHKVNDHHRRNWMQGDWTDDSDQMFLIMQSIVDCQGQVIQLYYSITRNGIITIVRAVSCQLFIASINNDGIGFFLEFCAKLLFC